MIGATLAALTFPGTPWTWAALVAAAILVPLAWTALAPAGRRSRTLAVGLALRTLGIGILALALLDPQWVGTRAARGENVFAIVADNSRGLAITEPAATRSRGRIMREQLLDPDAAWLETLEENFTVRRYAFSHGVHRLRDFSALDFSGPRSDLYSALGAVRERHTGQPLAGVLLLTDGNATDAPLPADQLAGLPPIYPVVVGTGPVPDIRIEQVSVRQTAFDDAPVEFDVEVAADWPQPATVEVHIDAITGSDHALPTAIPPPQRITLEPGSDRQIATFSWKPGGTGVRFFEVSLRTPEGDPIDDAAVENNRRLAMVDLGRAEFPLLYVSGRPGWDFKFLNRALVDDPQIRLVGLLRVARREPKFEFKGRSGESSNPMYRGFDDSRDEAPRYDQPVFIRVNVRDGEELAEGFPRTAEELFAYDGIILDDIEADAFGPGELSLLRRFVSERGGGLLMLGGADSLESGGYADSPLAAALPLHLGDRATGFDVDAFSWELTREGWVEPWVRVRTTQTAERDRLEAMPLLRVAHNLPEVKPGAMVLARFRVRGESVPALAVQRYGAGRTAVLNAGDLWRWGIRDRADQQDLARFWRQVARWLVTDTAAQMTIDARPADDGSRIKLAARVRDRAFRDESLARVALRIERVDPSFEQTSTGASPTFSSVSIEAPPVPERSGRYEVEFPSAERGGYLVHAEARDQAGSIIGKAEAGWVSDPAAEEFRSLAPNHASLAELARATGGEVLAWDDLAAFARDLPYRAAPVTETWSFPVWNTAWVFLIVLACFLGEWGWRRWRGLP